MIKNSQLFTFIKSLFKRETKKITHRCIKCGKPIYDKISVRRKMGPVCYKREGAKKQFKIDYSNETRGRGQA